MMAVVNYTVFQKKGASILFLISSINVSRGKRGIRADFFVHTLFAILNECVSLRLIFSRYNLAY